MKELVILFPDIEGKGTLGEFGQKLKSLDLPFSKRLVPILNGETIKNLSVLAKQAQEKGFKPIISQAKGLLPVLVEGYETVIKEYPGATVVRLDTAEHDPDYILKLAIQALEIKGMIIGDLQFGKGTLVEDSPDWFTHLYIFPITYGQFTNNKLRLSCAHGFQSFADTVLLGKILEGAKWIVREIESTSEESITWGFDGAMALSGYDLRVPQEIISVPAQKLRDRNSEKIAKQFANALTMCRAFYTLGE